MKTLYLYRNVGFKNNKHPNPYIHHLKDALSLNFTIVNPNNNKIGVLEPFLFLFKARFYYFNWIETLPKNRFGKFQTIMFLIFLLLAKGLKKKIVWTLHNKYAHNEVKNFWNDLMYKVLICYANVVITHSEAGVNFIGEKSVNLKSKVKYFVHPLTAITTSDNSDFKIYDFLIWGEVHPYKGIAEFLDFVNHNPEMQHYKILIIGQCFDEKYKSQIISKLNTNIIYDDHYYGLEDIASFAGKSEFILFTYNLTSILSSGSLMDSISMGATVIGPNDGAFKDLGEHCFVYNYNHFSDLPVIYKNHIHVKNHYSVEFTEYCNEDFFEFYKENTWANFGKKLNEALNNI